MISFDLRYMWGFFLLATRPHRCNSSPVNGLASEETSKSPVTLDIVILLIVIGLILIALVVYILRRRYRGRRTLPKKENELVNSTTQVIAASISSTPDSASPQNQHHEQERRMSFPPLASPKLLTVLENEHDMAPISENKAMEQTRQPEMKTSRSNYKIERETQEESKDRLSLPMPVKSNTLLSVQSDFNAKGKAVTLDRTPHGNSYNSQHQQQLPRRPLVSMNTKAGPLHLSLSRAKTSGEMTWSGLPSPTAYSFTITHTEASVSQENTLTNTTIISIPVYMAVTEQDYMLSAKPIHRGGTAKVHLCNIPEESAIRGFCEDKTCVAKLFDVRSSATSFQTQKLLHDSFLQEVAIMNYLCNSDCFAKLIAYDDTSSPNYYVLIMRYYRFGTLARYIQKGRPDYPFDTEQKHLFSIDLASAISIMHQLHIVHYDLKPANILLEPESEAEVAQSKQSLNTNGRLFLRAVITDFGLCQIVDAKAVVRAFAITNMNGATIRYASPEAIHYFRKQLPLQRQDLLKASDLYSLAMVIYEMVCKTPPYSFVGNENLQQIVAEDIS